MIIKITWPLVVLIIVSIAILWTSITEDRETRGGMMDGCMTIIGIAFVIVLWIIYGGIYWW